MALTPDRLKAILDEYQIAYQEEDGSLMVVVDCDSTDATYRNPAGDPRLLLMLKIVEKGEMFVVRAPGAYVIKGSPHAGEIATTLVELQSGAKLLRFDYEWQRNMICPNVEVPLEDAEPTSRQIYRAITAVVAGIYQFDPVIRRVIETGKISFAGMKSIQKLCRTSAAASLAAPAISLEDLVEQPGGPEEIERAMSGDSGPLDEAEARRAFDRIMGCEEEEDRAA